MPPHNADLYRAILAHPDEDTPRLAYADWLDENGEPKYAALIRSQVALADAPRHDPRSVQTWFHDRDLVTGRGFKPFLPELPDGVSWQLRPFRRGFPAAVEVDSPEAFARCAAELFAAAPIQCVKVHSEYRAPPPDIAPLTDSPFLTKLRTLTFTLSRLGTTAIQRLSDSPHAANLTDLAFEFAGIAGGDPTVTALIRGPLVPKLRSLKLDNNDLAWHATGQAIRRAGASKSLRRLTVVESGPRSFVYAKEVFGAPLLGGLTELRTSAELGPEGFETLCASRLAGRLESLVMSRSNPGLPGAKALAGCAALGNLRQLDLAWSSIGQLAAKHLAKSPHLSNLRVLDLTNNPIGDTGAVAIAESPHLRNLIHLELMHCEIGDAGAEALRKSPNTANLIHLNLHGDSRKAKIGDAMEKKLRKQFGDRVFV